jgi:hypothetical protein
MSIIQDYELLCQIQRPAGAIPRFGYSDFATSAEDRNQRKNNVTLLTVEPKDLKLTIS